MVVTERVSAVVLADSDSEAVPQVPVEVFAVDLANADSAVAPLVLPVEVASVVLATDDPDVVHRVLAP